jgi:molybdenum cofactor biosynthesis protein MoaC
VAEAVLVMRDETLKRVQEQTVPKGDALEVARVAAIQGVKNTSAIIPFCHPIPIEHAAVKYELGSNEITVRVSARSLYRTGVEMEAMTGATIAALTLYDMLKMLDETMEIRTIRLLEKRGGKSDFKDKLKVKLRAAVLVISDSVSQGKKSDKSGQIIVERLKLEGLDVKVFEILPDEPDQIEWRVQALCDEEKIELIVTTGGTGLGPRDSTPEGLKNVIEKYVPGISEAMRAHGKERTPFAMLSRGVAGTRGNSLILALPGSSRGVEESLDALFPGLLHSFPMMWGGSHPGKDER